MQFEIKNMNELIDGIVQLISGMEKLTIQIEQLIERMDEK